jgi:hypothetical protein
MQAPLQPLSNIRTGIVRLVDGTPGVSVLSRRPGGWQQWFRNNRNHELFGEEISGLR